MQDDVYQTMFEVEDRHWWYVAKQQIVLSLLRRYLPSANGIRPRVADLGCGCGAMLTRLSRDYDAIGIDGSPHAIDFCARRGVKAQPAICGRCHTIVRHLSQNPGATGEQNHVNGPFGGPEIVQIACGKNAAGKNSCHAVVTKIWRTGEFSPRGARLP